MKSTQELKATLINIIAYEQPFDTENALPSLDAPGVLDALEGLIISNTETDQALLYYLLEVAKFLDTEATIAAPVLVDFFCNIKTLYFGTEPQDKRTIRFKDNTYEIFGLFNSYTVIESEIRHSLLRPLAISAFTPDETIEALVQQLLTPVASLDHHETSNDTIEGLARQILTPPNTLDHHETSIDTIEALAQQLRTPPNTLDHHETSIDTIEALAQQLRTPPNTSQDRDTAGEAIASFAQHRPTFPTLAARHAAAHSEVPRSLSPSLHSMFSRRNRGETPQSSQHGVHTHPTMHNSITMLMVCLSTVLDNLRDASEQEEDDDLKQLYLS